MSEQRYSEVKSRADADTVAESIGLPDAPLAMPVQPLDSIGPLSVLRTLFGGFNRIVKH